MRVSRGRWRAGRVRGGASARDAVPGCKERAAGAGVVMAMQFVAETAVDPGNPNQGEGRGKLAEPAHLRCPAR
jgi:hypothetical protein